MIKLTPEQVEWVKATYKEHTLVETLRQFNERYGTTYSPSALKSCLPAHGIRSFRGAGIKPDNPRAWTPAKVDWLREHRPGRLIRDLLPLYNDHFGEQRTESQLLAACDRYGIQSGADRRFPSGLVPWNKGTKGLFSSNAKTKFPPGNRPHTYVPVGTRTKCDGLWRIKVADSPEPGTSRFGWRELHRVIWEEAHGPQPPGTCVVFLDGDPDHLELDNLLLVTRSQLARLNQLGWRRIADLEARRALVEQVRLMTKAHQLATEAHLSLSERRQLLPAMPKVPKP